METIEIVLLIIGCAVFIASFILPEIKDRIDPEVLKNQRENIQTLMQKEVGELKFQIEDSVEESIKYGIEKTERAMERLSNEKIMAVSDYSENVLQDINKAHQEVLFLYEMLNDKKNLMDQNMEHLLSMQKIIKSSEIIKTEDDSSLKNMGQEVKKQNEQETIEKNIVERKKRNTTKEQSSVHVLEEKPKTRKKSVTKSKIDVPVLNHLQDGQNSNERVLQLHKEGKSNMAIAKELGLGIGEVKLVIDLYEGA
jgi:hypothetical protein